MKRLASICVALLIGSTAAYAQHGAHGHKGQGHQVPGQQGQAAQPYAGQDKRSVAMLSDDEIAGFLAGRGMGLAKSGEVNGFPGPMHVLELGDQLQLTPDQRRLVTAAFDTMKAKATALGQRYVDAERAVDAAFKAHASQEVIAKLVATANALLGEIRMAHLDAHIAVTPVLSAGQRSTYAELRGYSGGSHDPSKHKH
jgi:hypothetical protein